MTANPDKPASLAEQHARFVETARKLGADEDKERFEEKLGRIARQKAPRGSKKEDREPNADRD